MKLKMKLESPTRRAFLKSSLGTSTSLLTWRSLISLTPLLTLLKTSKAAAQLIPATYWRNRAKKKGSIICALSNTTSYAVASADNGATWTRGLIPQEVIVANRSWGAFIYGGSKYCLLTSNSRSVSTSADGITWGAALLTDNANWISAAHNGTRYCAITNGSTLCNSSADGDTWVAGTLPTATNWTGVAALGSTFCAVSGSGAASTIAATSTDGVTWTQRTLPTSARWSAIAANSTTFCAIAGSGTASTVAATSTDGITWTARTLPTSTRWSAIASNGSLFVAVAGSGAATTIAATSSDNGATWTQQVMPASARWGNICWDGTRFCATDSNGGNYAFSTNGVTWTTGTVVSTTNCPCAGNAGRTLIAVGNSSTVTRSNDAFSTTQNSTVSTYNGMSWYNVVSNGSRFVAAAYDTNYLATSTDGINWTRFTISGIANNYNLISNGVMFFVTSGTNCWKSSDGLSWTQFTMSRSINSAVNVLWNGRYFYAFTINNNLFTSPDCVTWTTTTLSAPVYGTSYLVVWTGTQFGALLDAGLHSSFRTSPDGINWTDRTLPGATRYWTSLAWNGKVFSATCDAANTAAYSPDGINWTLTTMPTSGYWVTLVWNGEVFFSTRGQTANTFGATSPDGITWTSRDVGATGMWYAVGAL